MKERPILFSGPMVMAILDGRKTQTRPIVKQQPDSRHCRVDFEHGFLKESSMIGGCWSVSRKQVCPYGKPGDRLWVREAFWQAGCWVRPDALRDEGDAATVWQGSKDGVYYCADMPDKPDWGFRKRPSIHMPRWASRINLEITGVRVERLQAISCNDAISEGLDCLTKDGSLYKYGIADRDRLPGNDDHGWHWSEWEVDPRMAYKKTLGINQRPRVMGCKPMGLGDRIQKDIAHDQQSRPQPRSRMETADRSCVGTCKRCQDPCFWAAGHVSRSIYTKHISDSKRA